MSLNVRFKPGDKVAWVSAPDEAYVVESVVINPNQTTYYVQGDAYNRQFPEHELVPWKEPATPEVVYYITYTTSFGDNSPRLPKYALVPEYLRDVLLAQIAHSKHLKLESVQIASVGPWETIELDP